VKIFEFLEHTADMGVRVWGQNRIKILEHAAQGLYAIALSCQPQGATEKSSFQFKADTNHELLIHFLEELLYLLYTRNLAATQFQIEFVSETNVWVEGDFARIRPHDFALEIKSPTYHKLKFEKQQDGWIAEIYFDL